MIRFKQSSLFVWHTAILTAVALFCTCPAQAFKPTKEFGHVGIVRDALSSITRNTSMGVPLTFSERAILQMRDSTAGVDEVFSSRGELTTPRAHCDDELLPQCSARMRTIRNNVISILNTSRQGGRARAEVGRALHTLHDFYSHSNWVSIAGNPPFNSTLGRGAMTALPVTTPTCIDDFFDGTLTGAGLTMVTTGYFVPNPPAGKCVHGVIPGAGIHKDAPGRAFHPQARASAVAATVDFINQILDGIAGNDPALRAFMDVRPPVGFVIDNTGSMGPTIDGVQSAVASLVTALEAEENAPDQYVLVTFGDPTVSSAFVTSDGNALISRVNSISPGGGDDCPELAFTGLSRAVNAIDEEGTLYLFTDASAKDGRLAGNVKAAANRNNISIWVQQSGNCSGFGPEYDQSNGAPPKQHTLADAVVAGHIGIKELLSDGVSITKGATNPFIEITQGTGGQFVLSQNTAQAVADFFNVVGPAASGSLESVMLADGLLPAGAQQFNFPVDGTLDSLLVSVSFSTAGSVSLLRPGGAIVSNADSDATITSLATGQIIAVQAPQVGGWSLQVMGDQGESYSVIVSGETTIALTRFEFVEERGREEHTGLFPINGEPVAGEQQTVIANLAGPVTSASFGVYTPDAQQSESLSLTFGSDEGASDDYIGLYAPGTEPIRVFVSGQTESGDAYQRAFEQPISGQTVVVEPLQELTASEILMPEPFSAFFSVHNLGAEANFDFTGSSSLGLPVVVTPANALIAIGSSQEVEVTLEAGLRSEDFASVSLVAVGPDSSNSAVLLRPVVSTLAPFPAPGRYPAYMRTVNGTAGWFLDNTTAVEGAESLASSGIENSETASIETTAFFSGEPFRFARKVSSESSFDYLRFYVDDVLNMQWSGELDWELISVDISRGEHTVRWSYEKDGSVSGGDDTVWIDALDLILFFSDYEE